MSDKKRRYTTGRSIINILAIFPRLLSLFQKVVHKIKIETYLTIKNIIIFLMLALFLTCLLTASWISLLAILFFGLLEWHWSWYAAAVVVMLINMMSLIIVGIFIAKVKNRIIELLHISHFKEDT